MSTHWHECLPIDIKWQPVDSKIKIIYFIKFLWTRVKKIVQCLNFLIVLKLKVIFKHF